MRVKSPTLGSADLSELSLDAIDRIEIVRGPQSTLYGADAIGGVVNIITKRGTSAWHGTGFGYFSRDALNANSPLSVYNGGGFDSAAAPRTTATAPHLP